MSNSYYLSQPTLLSINTDDALHYLCSTIISMRHFKLELDKSPTSTDLHQKLFMAQEDHYKAEQTILGCYDGVEQSHLQVNINELNNVVFCHELFNVIQKITPITSQVIPRYMVMRDGSLMMIRGDDTTGNPPSKPVKLRT